VPYLSMTADLNAIYHPHGYEAYTDDERKQALTEYKRYAVSHAIVNIHRAERCTLFDLKSMVRAYLEGSGIDGRLEEILSAAFDASNKDDIERALYDINQTLANDRHDRHCVTCLEHMKRHLQQQRSKTT